MFFCLKVIIIVTNHQWPNSLFNSRSPFTSRARWSAAKSSSTFSSKWLGRASESALKAGRQSDGYRRPRSRKSRLSASQRTKSTTRRYNPSQSERLNRRPELGLGRLQLRAKKDEKDRQRVLPERMGPGVSGASPPWRERPGGLQIHPV